MTLVPEAEAWPNFGTVDLDLRTSQAKSLIRYCVAGSPTQCLIATATKAYVKSKFDQTPKNVSVHILHDDDGNVDPTQSRIGFTWGSWRYTRPLTPQEERIASKFDKASGKGIRARRLLVDLNTTGDLWQRTPKQQSSSGGHTPRTPGSARAKKMSLRGRSLRDWERVYGQKATAH